MRSKGPPSVGGSLRGVPPGSGTVQYSGRPSFLSAESACSSALSTGSAGLLFRSASPCWTLTFQTTCRSLARTSRMSTGAGSRTTGVISPVDASYLSKPRSVTSNNR